MWSRMPSSCKELVHLRHRVLDGHGDILLGDVRRRAGSAVTAVQLDDVRAGVKAADSHHVHVRRRGDLDGDQGPRVDRLDPVDMLLVVLHRVDTVKGERRKKRASRNSLPHQCDCRGHLVTKQMAAETGLRALSILELDDADPLDRLLPHPEKARRYLRDDVVVVGL